MVQRPPHLPDPVEDLGTAWTFPQVGLGTLPREGIQIAVYVVGNQCFEIVTPQCDRGLLVKWTRTPSA